MQGPHVYGSPSQWKLAMRLLESGIPCSGTCLCAPSRASTACVVLIAVTIVFRQTDPFPCH